MPRTIQLVVFPVQSSSPSNPEALPHWALLIPEEGSSTKGKIIHVIETRFHGFALEFKRNYNIANTQKPHHIFPLARVHSKYVRDTPVGDGRTVEADVVPKDVLENEAKKIDPVCEEPQSQAQAQSRALVRLDTHTFYAQLLTPIVQEKNCQDWMREYVECLIRKGIFPKTAIQVLDQAKTLEASTTSKF